MDIYPSAVEKQMQRFYHWLNERDRRRYVAVEAVRLGHGGQGLHFPVIGLCPQDHPPQVNGVGVGRWLAHRRAAKKRGGRKRLNATLP